MRLATSAIPARSAPIVRGRCVAARARRVRATGDGDDDSSRPATAARRPPAGARAAASIIDTVDCTDRPEHRAVSGDTITIGTSLPQSGIYAAFIRDPRTASRRTSTTSNANGGVEVAGKKYKIKLVAKDDAYDASKTVTNVQSLVDERQGVRAVQRRRHEEQPRDPRLRQRAVRARPVRGERRDRSGAITSSRG